jgi:hypothetical protein
MSKISKLALCVSLTLLLAGAFFVVSAAGTHQAGPSRDISGLRLPPPTAFEGLRSNFITSAIVNAVAAAGFNIEDSVQFQCGSTGATSCTLVVDSFATSSGGGVANDDRALCLVVDGAIVGACAYNGYDTADGSYSAISSINEVSGLAVGNHSAETLFYTTFGSTVYTFTNNYSVYKP